MADLNLNSCARCSLLEQRIQHLEAELQRLTAASGCLSPRPDPIERIIERHRSRGWVVERKENGLLFHKPPPSHTPTAISTPERPPLRERLVRWLRRRFRRRCTH